MKLSLSILFVLSKTQEVPECGLNEYRDECGNPCKETNCSGWFSNLFSSFKRLSLKHYFESLDQTTQLIHHFVCKFVPICVFVTKDLPGMKMENVFLMASVFLSVHVDQMNIVMNVETLAKKQTAMMIQMIHPSVLKVSVTFSSFHVLTEF